MERKAAKILATMTKFWPQIDIDGVFNIWIVKPGNKCRGKGIQLMNNIKDIVGLINIPAQKTRYVVQKYIGTHSTQFYSNIYLHTHLHIIYKSVPFQRIH